MEPLDRVRIPGPDALGPPGDLPGQGTRGLQPACGLPTPEPGPVGERLVRTPQPEPRVVPARPERRRQRLGALAPALPRLPVPVPHAPEAVALDRRQRLLEAPQPLALYCAREPAEAADDHTRDPARFRHHALGSGGG